jgi:hypothetical protein
MTGSRLLFAASCLVAAGERNAHAGSVRTLAIRPPPPRGPRRLGLLPLPLEPV